jgi:hypothetical protein
MTRYFIPALAAAALAVPAGAQAKVVELGAGGQPAAKSNCPADPCATAFQVTAYQGRSGNLKNPFVIPRPGKIVAFSVSLGALTPVQVQAFQGSFGENSEVQLSILRRSTKRGTRSNHRLMSQSKVYRVNSFFGSTPTFALDEPLRVQKDYRVALTVVTWAPVLDTVDLPGTNWWRSSRPKGECGGGKVLSPPSVHDELKEIVSYGCTYFKSRFLYTATYIPDPRPTDTPEKPKKKASASNSSAALPAVQLSAAGGGALTP